MNIWRIFFPWGSLQDPLDAPCILYRWNQLGTRYCMPYSTGEVFQGLILLNLQKLDLLSKVCWLAPLLFRLALPICLLITHFTLCVAKLWFSFRIYVHPSNITMWFDLHLWTILLFKAMYFTILSENNQKSDTVLLGHFIPWWILSTWYITGAVEVN